MTPRKCYDCTHRRGVPGSAHSSCHHPLTAAIHADSFATLLGLLGSRTGFAFVRGAQSAAEELHIEAVPHGVARGWFLWPVNFDPTWLVRCDGFTPRDGAASPGEDRHAERTPTQTADTAAGPERP
jgi:hypothetical protein